MDNSSLIDVVVSINNIIHYTDTMTTREEHTVSKTMHSVTILKNLLCIALFKTNMIHYEEQKHSTDIILYSCVLLVSVRGVCRCTFSLWALSGFISFSFLSFFNFKIAGGWHVCVAYCLTFLTLPELGTPHASLISDYSSL